MSYLKLQEIVTMLLRFCATLQCSVIFKCSNAMFHMTCLLTHCNVRSQHYDYRSPSHSGELYIQAFLQFTIAQSLELPWLLSTWKIHAAFGLHSLYLLSQMFFNKGHRVCHFSTLRIFKIRWPSGSVRGLHVVGERCVHRIDEEKSSLDSLLYRKRGVHELSYRTRAVHLYILWGLHYKPSGEPMFPISKYLHKWQYCATSVLYNCKLSKHCPVALTAIDHIHIKNNFTETSFNRASYFKYIKKLQQIALKHFSLPLKHVKYFTISMFRRQTMDEHPSEEKITYARWFLRMITPSIMAHSRTTLARRELNLVPGLLHIWYTNAYNYMLWYRM